MSFHKHQAGDSPDLEYGSWKYDKSNAPKHDDAKKQVVIEERKVDTSKFDMVYRKLGNKLKPEEKRIDYVLVHPKVNLKEITDEDEKQTILRQNQLREKFEDAVKRQGLLKQTEVIMDKVYTKLHCPFKRLCEEAEIVCLEMPLRDCESENKDEATSCGCFNRWIKTTFETDDEVDMVSAPFRMDRINLYENFDDPKNFFRPSVRSLLVEHILINIDLRNKDEKFGHAGAEDVLGSRQTSSNTDGNRPVFTHREFVSKIPEKSFSNCWGCLGGDPDDELGDMQKVGLDYMIMDKVYTEKFILHEESQYDSDNADNKTGPEKQKLTSDPRLDMQNTWCKFFKFQPLWKIRNYFGEKIAFYFAWSGTLITTLWIPMLFGLSIFIYGLIKSVSKSVSQSSETNANLTSQLTDLFSSVKESFDNAITPYYAMVICIWGTLFLEIWKRKQATLAYQWDVEQFEENEPDRPEFYGTKTRVDPVTKQTDWYYPVSRKMFKLFISSMTLIFMVCLVIVSVLAVIVYRVVATVDYCPSKPPGECMMVSTIVSSLLNAISILILGKVYDILARKLTDWENHRTQTSFNDALIIKLFAFQFVNNYASCFYIAFFRGRFDDFGVLNRGSAYQDDCEGTCMSQLSFQVLILMLTKPIPKFLSDVILPWAKTQFIKRCQCCACLPCLRKFLRQDLRSDSEKSLLEIESVKPKLGEFTLSEYTEKIIQYGLMMLFAASFPLAPLLAILTNLIDLRIDARRMLWWYQRPLAIIAEDIGTWYVILTFINFIGVVTNAFLIAFTSSWGSNFDSTGKLWIVIGFEHIVFCIKFLLAYLIPDVPAEVALAIRKKRYQLAKKIEQDVLKDKELVAVTTHNNYNSDYKPPREKVYVEAEDRTPFNAESRYLNREDTRATSPWRRTGRKVVGNYESFQDETEMKGMKKKKKKSILSKDEDAGVHGRQDLMTPDYSGRASSMKMRTSMSGDDRSDESNV